MHAHMPFLLTLDTRISTGLHSDKVICQIPKVDRLTNRDFGFEFCHDSCYFARNCLFHEKFSQLSSAHPTIIAETWPHLSTYCLSFS